jgi:hypothetical protein
MRKRRWPIRLGAALIVVAGLVAAVAALRLQGDVEAGPRSQIPAPAACSSSPVNAGEPIAPQLGAWWKSVERLDDAGSLVGRQVFVGRDRAAVAVLDLAPESAVSGPVGGTVVATTDAGSRSEIRLVSVGNACAWVAYQTTDVVRSAILDPQNGTLFLHLLDRSTRTDRGIWRLPGISGSVDEPALVARPLTAASAAVASVGVVWSTQLRLDARGAKLAVQSCGDLGCLVRVVDLRDAPFDPLVLGGPDQGDLLGFAGEELVAWARCPGLPCSVMTWDPSTGRRRTLVDSASSAGLTGDGRRLVAVISNGQGSVGLEIDPATGAARPLVSLPPGLAPLPQGADATTGLEVADDEIVIGSPASDPRAFRPDGPPEVVP